MPSFSGLRVENLSLLIRCPISGISYIVNRHRILTKIAMMILDIESLLRSGEMEPVLTFDHISAQEQTDWKF